MYLCHYLLSTSRTFWHFFFPLLSSSLLQNADGKILWKAIATNCFMAGGKRQTRKKKFTLGNRLIFIEANQEGEKETQEQQKQI